MAVVVSPKWKPNSQVCQAYCDGVVQQVSHHCTAPSSSVDGRSRCEYHASAVGYLVDIAAFWSISEDFCARWSRDLPRFSFSCREQVLIVVCLVNVETVNAKLFKVITSSLRGTISADGFPIPFGSLQRLDCEAFRTARLEFFQTFFDFYLLLQESFLSFCRNGIRSNWLCR